MQGLNEEQVCKNHLILGQHLYKNLDGRDFDLYGGAKFRSKGNKVNLKLPLKTGILKLLYLLITQ